VSTLLDLLGAALFIALLALFMALKAFGA